MPTETGRPCRLLLAIPELDRGGPDRVIFELARSLDRDRFDLHVAVVSPDGYYLGELPPDVDIHRLGTGSVRSFDRYPGLRLARLTREIRPDVVMATLRMIVAAELTNALPRNHALVTRVAGHVTAHREDGSETTGARSKVFHDLMLRGIRHADIAVAQSTSMADDLVAAGIAADRVRTIANPIDGAWVDARTAEGPPTPLRGTPRLLAVGRLEMQKGFDILIEALPAVRAAHPGVHVTVLGEGSQRAALEAQARQLGVHDTITFAGTDPNPFRSYASADLLVAPSRWEGLSNTTLEALASGVPVVATDGPAAGQDLVTSTALGRLTRPDDPAAFADAVLDALATTFDRSHIAADTRQRFASASIVEAYAEMLLDAAAPRRGGGGGSTSRAALVRAKARARDVLSRAGVAVSPGPRSPEVTWRAPGSRAKAAALIELVNRDGALRGDDRLRVLDVGARWGLEPGMDLLVDVADHWVVGVDPDPAAAADLRRSGQFDEVLEVALADASGVRPLYLTRHPGCSSLRRPLPGTAIGALRCADWFDVVDEIEVEVTTLDAAAPDGRFDFVKLDAQGADLDVLAGGSRALANALGMFVEVQFEAFYEGQALFPDIHDWATNHGFTLVSMSNGFQRKEGVLGEANCTYLTQPTRLQTRRDVLASVVIAAALDEWGYVDLVLRSAGSVLAPDDVEGLRQASGLRARGPRRIETPND